MSTEFINDQWRLPNAFNGTESNVNKQSNYSMDFDGSSQYVDLGDDDIFSFGNSTNDSPFSISAWIYMDSTTNFRILAKYDAPNYEYQFDVGGSSNLRFFIFDGSSYRARTGSTLSANQWYHVVATYNGVGDTNAQDGIKIYVDGVEITGTTDSNGSYTAMHNTTAPVYIGRIASSYANGQIDGVAIFNYALSSSQVTTLYGSSSTGIGNPMSLSPKPVFYAPLGDQDAFNGANYLVPNSSLKDYVFSFNGTSSKIVTTEENLGTTNTISFWHKRPTGTYSNKVVIGGNTLNRFDGTIILNSYQLAIGFPTDKALYFTDNIFSASKNASGVNIPYEDVWVHYCITRNGTTQSDINLYVNSYLVTSSKAEYFGAVDYTTNTTVLNLGAASAQSNFSEGELSNISTFTTAFNQSQVNTLYNNGTPSDISSLTPNNWWKLDASDTYDISTGNWTIKDHAGSNNGTSSGMTQANLVQSDLSFKTSYSPYAFDFDGISDSVSIPYNSSSGLNLLSNFSVSIWINIDTSSFRNGAIGNYNNVGGFAIELRGTLSTPLIRFFIGDSVGLKEATAELSLVQTGWHHIVGTFDGTTLKIYTDSVKGTDATAASNMVLSTSYLAIGGEPIGYYFNGKLSNASYWNTALNQTQITEIYNEGVPSNLNNHSAYSNLVSWWQLGSNSSFNTNWTVLDEKGSNNGTSSSMGEDAIVDGVGSYANGLSSGMGGDEVIGNAPYSSSNALSVNMDVEDRVEDTPS